MPDEKKVVSCGRDTGDEDPRALEDYYTLLRRQGIPRHEAEKNKAAAQPNKLAFVVSIGGRSTELYKIPSQNKPYGVPSFPEDEAPKPKL